MFLKFLPQKVINIHLGKSGFSVNQTWFCRESLILSLPTCPEYSSLVSHRVTALDHLEASRRPDPQALLQNIQWGAGGGSGICNYIPEYVTITVIQVTLKLPDFCHKGKRKLRERSQERSNGRPIPDMSVSASSKSFRSWYLCLIINIESHCYAHLIAKQRNHIFKLHVFMVSNKGDKIYSSLAHRKHTHIYNDMQVNCAFKKCVYYFTKVCQLNFKNRAQML